MDYRRYFYSRAVFGGLVCFSLMACAQTEIYHPETGKILYRSNKDQVWHVEHCKTWEGDVCHGRTVVDVGASTPEIQALSEAIKRIPVAGP